MDKINVILLYPIGYDKEYTETKLNSIQLQALLGSSKVGSDGNYFLIKEIIFDDLSSEDEIYELTVILDKVVDS